MSGEPPKSEKGENIIKQLGSQTGPRFCGLTNENPDTQNIWSIIVYHFSSQFEIIIKS